MIDDPVRFRLEDIRRYGREALDVLGERSAEDLRGDRIRELALVRLVEIVGEAVSKLPPEVRRQAPQVDWRAAVAMRNVLIHAYGQVRMEMVVSTVREDFPGLIDTADNLLKGDS